jgi:hypothetical protein
MDAGEAGEQLAAEILDAIRSGHDLYVFDTISRVPTVWSAHVDYWSSGVMTAQTPMRRSS